jgi:hypothetical protein
MKFATDRPPARSGALIAGAWFGYAGTSIRRPA